MKTETSKPAEVGDLRHHRKSNRRDIIQAFGRGLVASSFWLLFQKTSIAGAYGEKWVCTDADCDPYVYDPNVGDPDNIADPDNPILPGTSFQSLPETWLCPLCGSQKSEFIRYYEVG
jgi:rubredoxin